MSDKNTKDLYVSWSQYHQLIEDLAAQIAQSAWSFESILCLARGGLRVGDILSRIFDCPMAILAASSYDGDRQQSTVVFAESLTIARLPLKPNILIVDDLVDSGKTLAATIPWLEAHHQIPPAQCRTAVLWYKRASCVKPDFYVDYLPHNPWIHQPFETYETWSPKDLSSP